jgi:uncharacterized protein (DUF58 family)
VLPREVLRQVRRLQLRARRVVESLFGGAYHSAFKGAGLAFDEVREYQAGDDVRAIDWNVTARAGHPFIKRFVEERELTIILAVDVSDSQGFGTRLQTKRQVVSELAAVLAFSALANNDRAALLQFSDRIEHYVPPRKGSRHVLRIIRDAFLFRPTGRGTSLRTALDFLARVLHRRAVVFLFSDFLDRDFERQLRRTGRRHDLITVHVVDPAEEELPDVGLLEWQDSETDVQATLDTGSPGVREAFRQAATARREALRRLTRQANADLIEASSAGGHLDALMRFFRLRERRHGRR